jgi:hypothetical protein
MRNPGQNRGIDRAAAAFGAFALESLANFSSQVGEKGVRTLFVLNRKSF